MEDDTSSGVAADARIAPLAARLMRLGGNAALALSLVALLVLAAPPFKEHLGVVLTPRDREWLEYASYATELLLLAMFGEAIYSRRFAEIVRDRCEHYQREISADFGLDKLLLQACINDLKAFWTGSAGDVTFKQFGRALRSANRLRARY